MNAARLDWPSWVVVPALVALALPAMSFATWITLTVAGQRWA